MAMRMAAAAAAAALVAVMCELAPREESRGGSSTEETSSQNSSSNQTGARCYTGETPDADAAAQAASAATPATPQPLPPHPPRREDELVDGWPTWLLNNVPREALQGIVPKSVDAYEKIKKVGEGSYNSVYKARERGTGRIVALKKVEFNRSDSESVRFMAREIQFLRRLDHPNVMKLEGVATSRRSIYLVFDFMYDDLARLVFRSSQCLTEPQIKRYMQQLLEGLQHCHERGILHLDIKHGNLTIDRNGVLKIGDFGLSSYYGAGHRLPPPNRVASLPYRAPELLLGATSYGVGVDLWSVGCLLAEMFIGKTLIHGSGEKGQLLKIFELFGSPPEDYWRKMELSPSLKPPEPYKSTTAERFRDLPPSTIGLLATLLAFDPAARGTAGQALQSSQFFSTPPLPCDLSALPVVYEEEVDAWRRRQLPLKFIRVSDPGAPLKLVEEEEEEDGWTDDELTDMENSGQEPVIDTGNPGQEESAAANASSSANDGSSEKTIVNASSSTVAKRFSGSPVVQEASPVQMVAQDQKQVPTANTSHHSGNDDDGEEPRTIAWSRLRTTMTATTAWRRRMPKASRSGSGTVIRGPESRSAAFESDFEAAAAALRGSDEFPSSKQYVLEDRV